MKEAIVSGGAKVFLQDSPIPKPKAGEVLIRVVVSGSNPKDWKYPTWTNRAFNSGDDIAGIVEEVGEDVTEFKKGDRVAAFHEMGTPSGSFAEYAISWAYTTFHIPNKTSFEEAATIPLAALTSVFGLYHELGLPEPWRPATEKTPLIIYGGASSVGAFAIKLANRSNIHPLIVVAGNGQDFVESLIDPSKGDAVVDYRKGNDAVVSGIQEALKNAGASEVKYAYDAISEAEKNTFQNISQVLAKEGKVTFVLPLKDPSIFAESVVKNQTSVGKSHKDIADGGNKDLAFIFSRLFTRGLQEGWFTTHPYEVVPGGLNGVQKGLEDLQNGVNSGLKYVFRIEDTK